MSKGLNALGKLTGTQNLTMYEQNECLNIIEKELKAFEIIKEKDVSMYWLRNSKCVDEYNNFILTDKRQYQKLTKEEFELLKEVMLCD